MAFEHTYPGQQLRIKSSDWNGAMDAARAVASGETGLRAQVFRGGEDEWLVRNDSGADVGRYGVLGIGGPIVTPDDNIATFKNSNLLFGVEPTGEYSSKFCVTLAPIADGKVGPCLTMGVAKVLVDNELGDFADVVTGETGYLGRGDSGGRILWVDSTEYTTDRFWAYVAIGGSGGTDCACDEVHELKTENNPTAGSVGLTYTVNGVTGSSSTINYNSTAAAAKTAIVASNTEFTSANVETYDGPWPFVSIYIRFVDNLTGQVIALPAVSNSLTGTDAVPKLGRLTSPGWP